MPPFYFLTFAKVSVSVSKKFGLKKVSVSVSNEISGLVTQWLWAWRKYFQTRNNPKQDGFLLWQQEEEGERQFIVQDQGLIINVINQGEEEEVEEKGQ